jgi:hypothetical protein
MSKNKTLMKKVLKKLGAYDKRDDFANNIHDYEHLGDHRNSIANRTRFKRKKSKHRKDFTAI